MYHYAANNPVRYVDPDGREAWNSHNEWSPEYIDSYSKYVDAKINEYMVNKKKFTCEDLSLNLLIDFASENNLPVTIINGSGTYSSYSSKFSSIGGFRNKVLSSTGASDLEANTISLSVADTKAGDLICMDTGTPNGTKDNKYSHIQVISEISDNIMEIRQGNILGGSSKYRSIFYGGKPITKRSYNFKDDIFMNTSTRSNVFNASSAFGMSFRRWNFYGM